MHYRRSSVIPFFLVSLSLHLIFLFAWSPPPQIEKIREPIPIAFLPLPEEKKAEPLPESKPREPVARPSRPKPKQALARKTTPPSDKATPLPKKAKRRTPELQAPPLQARKRKVIVRRPLPSLEELLPPINWSGSERESIEEGAIRLDTQEPEYVSYLSSIKRAIELVWQYPDLALRHGLQGKLVLEFTVLGNGTLMGTRLIRSSGFSILDEEAIHAIQAAAPFRPIPPWIEKNPLAIIASFEYLDSRLNYTFAP